MGATLEAMSQKTIIYIGLFVGSSLGGWLGSLLDGGNWLGGWSILGDTIGAFAGIWIGYKLSRNY